MDRRKVIVLVGALVAVLGAAVVFVYVKGADSRADQKFAAQQVLVAKTAITPGETLATAQTEGKLETKSVTSASLVPGAVADASAISDKDVALTAIYPGEQILSSKFGAQVTTATSTLTIPKGDVAISIQLTDTGRVAGFVNPGDHVVIFNVGSTDTAGAAAAATAGAVVLLPDVEVIAVGATTTTPTTTTDPTGTQTTEQVSNTLFTLGVSQADAQKILGAVNGGLLSFGLRDKDSVVTAQPAAK